VTVLFALLVAAFVVESAVGFGSALVVVGVGAWLVPLAVLLVVFQPLSLLLSLTIVVRDWRFVDVSLLLRRVLPAMVPGVAVGMVAARHTSADGLLLVVGPAIVLLALLKLAELVRNVVVPARSAVSTSVALLGAGVLHGLAGTSGPLVVWAIAGVVDDKRRFRATLGLLWLLLSVVLVLGAAADGTLTHDQLVEVVQLSPAVLIGFVIGNALHHRIGVRAFSVVVCVVLVFAGIALTVRGLSSAHSSTGTVDGVSIGPCRARDASPLLDIPTSSRRVATMVGASSSMMSTSKRIWQRCESLSASGTSTSSPGV
jgi:uncharacterized membrane protein YfcA